MYCRTVYVSVCVTLGYTWNEWRNVKFCNANFLNLINRKQTRSTKYCWHELRNVAIATILFISWHFIDNRILSILSCTRELNCSAFSYCHRFNRYSNVLIVFSRLSMAVICIWIETMEIVGGMRNREVMINDTNAICRVSDVCRCVLSIETHFWVSSDVSVWVSEVAMWNHELQIGMPLQIHIAEHVCARLVGVWHRQRRSTTRFSIF